MTTQRQCVCLGPAQPLKQSVFMTVIEAATVLRISPVTLSRWRVQGSGPAYHKLGRRIVYSRADVIAWAESRRRLSTSEPDPGAAANHEKAQSHESKT
jgi:hypothetical protein